MNKSKLIETIRNEITKTVDKDEINLANKLPRN